MLDTMGLTRERKMILIIGAVLLMCGAIYRFYPDLAAFFNGSDEIAMTENHVKKYLKVVAQKPAAEKENRLVKRQFKQMEDRLLTGETSSLAAVEIQDILNGIGEVSGVKFMTMRVMKPVETEEAAYVRLPVQFSMNADVGQLKEIIYKIEASPKLLIVTELDAHLARSKDQDLIRTTMTVEGIMKAFKAGK